MVSRARGVDRGAGLNHRHSVSDWIMLLSLTVMWGSAFLLTKIAVGSLPPTLVVTGRLAVASLVLVLIAVAVLRRLPTGRRLWLFFVLIALFGDALPFSLISWGQSYIESSLAGILMAVIPLVTLGLAHFAIPGERMTPQRAGGFVLGFAGIAILLGPGALSALGDWRGQLLPMLAVLGGAVSYAICTILARLSPTTDALSTAAITTLIATMLMLPVGLQSSDLPRLSELSVVPVLAIMMLGVFSTGIAAIIYFRLVKRAGPAFVSLLSYLIPLWAVGMGMVFADETLQPGHLYALVLIFGGIFVTQLKSQRGDPVPRPANEVTT